MKKSNVISAVETLVAIVLFLSMLFACGKYIDIKINGKSSSLPKIPDNDMQILLQTLPSISTIEKHTLAEPVSVGLKTGNLQLMAYTKEARDSLLEYSRSHVIRCFSGESTQMNFKNNEEALEYISLLCENNDYLFLNFYSDLPAAAFLPSLAREYESKDSRMYFNVQNLFLLPDNEQNLYAVAVSSGKNINILVPDEKIMFEPSDYDAYNDITGFAEFEHDRNNCLLPVFAGSIEQNMYYVNNASSVFGMKVEADWIQNTMEVFGLNKNFSKTFVTRDNTLIDFIDDTNELMFSSDGSVKYYNNADGLELYDLLSYSPSDVSYTFPDKTLAVKRLFNKLGSDVCGKDANLSITNVYYDEENAKLCFELKYFASGIAVTNKDYDAFVSMSADMITHVYFDALVCERLDGTSPSLPQKYAFFGSDEESVVCHYRLLSKEQDSDNYSVVFATLTEKHGEDE